MLPQDAVLEHHAVAITGGEIVDVLPASAAAQRYPGAQVIDLPDHAVIPGLINLHTHTAMTLMRGMADDLPLMAWLQHHIWPTESRVVNADFVHDGALAKYTESLDIRRALEQELGTPARIHDRRDQVLCPQYY